MAWGASQLFFQRDPAILAALRAIPSLEGHLYDVPHLLDLATRSEEPFAVLLSEDGQSTKQVNRGVTRVPAFPPGGLLVVQALADPEEGDGPWAVNWNCFDQTALDVPMPLACPPLEWCFTGAAAGWGQYNPPGSLCRAAAALAHETRTVAAYLSIETWGGDLEYAIGWVWDGRAGRATFLHATSAMQGDDEPRANGLPGAIEVTPAGSRFVAGGDVVSLALLHFDVLLKSGYFEPHTSRFPWERYRVG